MSTTVEELGTLGDEQLRLRRMVGRGLGRIGANTKVYRNAPYPFGGGGLAALEDARSDLIDTISSIPLIKREQVEKAVADLEKTVEARAAVGAEKAVKPLIIKGAIISAVFTLITIVAVRSARKRMRAATATSGLRGLGETDERHLSNSRSKLQSGIQSALTAARNNVCFEARKDLQRASEEIASAKTHMDSMTIKDIETRKQIISAQNELNQLWTTFGKKCFIARGDEEGRSIDVQKRSRLFDEEVAARRRRR